MIFGCRSEILSYSAAGSSEIHEGVEGNTLRFEARQPLHR